MRALIQRVRDAAVRIEGETVGEIGQGLLILVCAMQGDPEDAPEKLATRIAKLRIFRDDEGRMNRSVADIGGACLVVSQFTLAADLRSGNRPGFSQAAQPDIARTAYERFAAALAQSGLAVQTGRFGADMAVSLTNDGPVTIWMDSTDRS